MKTRNAPPSLHRLLDYLDNLTERAPPETLEAYLRDLDITVDDVRPFARFSEDRYLRNLVCDGPFYHALVLCWRSGQRSPIHNHANSTCGVRVLSGTATETVFETTPSGLIKPVSSENFEVGAVSASADGFIHQISNLEAPGSDLVTLHVYSPPLLRMDTFSLTEAGVGEYRPMILEHALGSGI